MVKLKTIFLLAAVLIAVFGCQYSSPAPKITGPNDLLFDSLALRWDEAIPIGNGLLGALIWEREGQLRFSLDRSDLWDLRPMENLKKPKWSYAWVYGQWKNNNYKAVQDEFDKPYNESPAPSKIPAGALEFDLRALGKERSVHLNVQTGLCEVNWENGARLFVFLDAKGETGWYRFENISFRFPA